MKIRIQDFLFVLDKTSLEIIHKRQQNGFYRFADITVKGKLVSQHENSRFHLQKIKEITITSVMNKDPEYAHSGFIRIYPANGNDPAVLWIESFQAEDIDKFKRFSARLDKYKKEEKAGKEKILKTRKKKFNTAFKKFKKGIGWKYRKTAAKNR